MRIWNPRFVAYARAHGGAPKEQLKLDEEAYPGGKMAGFIFWVEDRWHEWRSAPGHTRHRGHTPCDHCQDSKGFDAWLSQGATR